MYLPSVRATGKTRRQIVQFGGLNYTEDTRDGELSDSRGLSCGAFPGLSQRLGRHKLQDAKGVSSIYAWGKLVTVVGTTLYYGDQVVGTVTPGKKQFAVVNSKLVVWPDRKYIDLSTDPHEFKSLDAKVVRQQELAATFGADSLTLQADEILITQSNFFSNERPNLNASDHRTDRGTYYYVKVYDRVAWDEDTGSWAKEGERELWMMDDIIKAQVGKYIILAEPAFEGGMYLNTKEVRETRTANGGDNIENTLEVLADYEPDSKSGLYGIITAVKVERKDYLYYGEKYVDEVTITYEVHNGGKANRSFVARGFKPGDVVTISGCDTFPANNRDVKIAAVTDTSLTFDSPVFTAGEEAGAVTVERRVPDLDFICESGNRLFGVSNKDKTIYASALGDPRNFFDYTGVATDSYAVVTGTDGDFTGCVAFGGSVFFFKEDCVHRLVGDFPAEYAVYVDHVAGVQKGCAGSIVLLNEVLYYKGREGIYAYTGATPRLISGALGNVRYDSAVVGVDGSVLYVSMHRQDTDTWELLTYDTRRGLWLKEDTLEAGGFAQLDGVLHMLAGGAVWRLGQGETDDGVAIAWEATFTPFTETVHERKYPSRLLLRLELGPGAWVEAELARDGGVFQTVWSSHDSNALTAVIPIRPGRCDRYTVRLRGKGRCLIRSMAREFALGGVR